MRPQLDSVAWHDLHQHAQWRCFLAWWPDAAMGAHLGQLASRMQQRYGGRAMQAQHMHLTLAFMGASTPEQLLSLQPRLQQLDWQPFTLSFNGLGVFEKAGVLWLEPNAMQQPQLDALQHAHEQLWALLQSTGWVRSERRFVPHISLLRRYPSGQPVPQLDVTDVTIHFKHAYLIVSVPTEQGSQYRILSRLSA